jgi:hypothetical protein
MPLTLSGLRSHRQPLFAALAVVTMVVGNLAALAQTRLARPPPVPRTTGVSSRGVRLWSARRSRTTGTIHDIDETDGRPFIVMELLEGQTLGQRIAARHLDLDDLLNAGMQVAEALEAAHAKGIVHRDIKAANIFITEGGQTKILDFGLAKLNADHRAAPAVAEAASSPTATAPSTPITAAGQAIGTAAYMSPEQVRGEELDERTDVFSCGVVTYEMATGNLPFPGATAGVVFDGILNKRPIPATQLNPSLPVELEVARRPFSRLQLEPGGQLRHLGPAARRRPGRAGDDRSRERLAAGVVAGRKQPRLPIGARRRRDLRCPCAGWPRTQVSRQISEASLRLLVYRWAPRGDALYLEGVSSGVTNLWRVAVDPQTLRWVGGPERLTTGGVDSDMALSPNGERLAFVSRTETRRGRSG